MQVLRRALCDINGASIKHPNGEVMLLQGIGLRTRHETSRLARSMLGSLPRAQTRSRDKDGIHWRSTQSKAIGRYPEQNQQNTSNRPRRQCKGRTREELQGRSADRRALQDSTAP